MSRTREILRPHVTRPAACSCLAGNPADLSAIQLYTSTNYHELSSQLVRHRLVNTDLTCCHISGEILSVDEYTSPDTAREGKKIKSYIWQRD